MILKGGAVAGVLVIVGAVLAGGCSSGDGKAAATTVSAAKGGLVTYGDELTLQVPAGSLSGDVDVKVEKIDKIPDGDRQGFTAFGQGYQLSPHGTEFSLLDPAILKIKYDRPALMAAGLDPQTLQVFYLDEDSGAYVAVAGHVDESEGVVVARVEHFSIYLPLARAFAAGGAQPPTIASQSMVPSQFRAPLPTLVRATVRDLNTGGALVSVSFSTRGTSYPMHRDPGAEADTWIGLIPSSAVWTPDKPVIVKAVNSLGQESTQQQPTVTFNESWDNQNVRLVPASLTMTAGSSRTLQFQAQAAGWFDLPPDSVSEAVSFPLGSLSVRVGGVTFDATRIGTTVLRACIVKTANQPRCADATITVTNGDVQRLVFLDEDEMPIDGTRTLVEGRRYSFDVRGEDAWGNRILVRPALALSPGLGVVDANGLVDTLDGNDFGTLTATLAGLTQVQHLRVVQRQWVDKGGGIDLGNSRASSLLALAMAGGTPYLASVDSSAGSDSTMRVWHWDGARWVQDGGAIAIGWPTGASLAYGGGAPWIAFGYFPDGPDSKTGPRVSVRRFDGVAWQPVDAGLLVDPAVGSGYPALAFSGGTPYVAWLEGITKDQTRASRIFVKHWNGSQWVQDGGPLNFDTQTAIAPLSPRLAFLGQTPYVAWSQEPGSNDLTRWTVRLKHWDGMNWVADDLGASATRSLPGGLAAGRLRGGAVNAMGLALSHGDYGASRGLLARGPQWAVDPMVPIGDGKLGVSPIGLASDDDEPYVLWAPTDRGAFVSHLSSNYLGTGKAQWTQNGGNLLPPGNSAEARPYAIASGGGKQWVALPQLPGVHVMALEPPDAPPRLDDAGVPLPDDGGGMSMPDLQVSVMPDQSVTLDMSISPDMSVLPDLTVQPDLVGALCKDGIKDGGESDIDCGGPCAKCGPSKACGNNADCASNLCSQSRCALGLSFGAAKPFGLGTAATALVVAEVTGDNRLDALVANRDDSTIGVLAGNGDGTFGKMATYGTGGNPTGLTVGDLDKDGIVDLAFSGADLCSVMLGKKGGGYAPWSSVDGFGNGAVLAYDWNGDGDLDLVSGGGGGPRSHLGQGNGMFGVATVLAGVAGDGLVAADVDNDGAVDLIAIDNTGIQINRVQKGAFQAGWSLAEPGVVSVAAGDLDGDGFADVVAGYAGSKDVGFYKGDKSAHLAAAKLIAAGATAPGRVALGDLDLDGRADLIVTKEGDNKVWVLHGHGDGTFDSDQVSPWYAAGLSPREVVVADVNADGKPDLVVLAWGAAQVNVLLNISQ